MRSGEDTAPPPLSSEALLIDVFLMTWHTLIGSAVVEDLGVVDRSNFEKFTNLVAYN